MKEIEEVEVNTAIRVSDYLYGVSLETIRDVSTKLDDLSRDMSLDENSEFRQLCSRLSAMLDHYINE